VTCFYPLQVWRSKDGDRPNGRLRLVFHSELGIPNTEQLIPCGQCTGCRLERSRQWAMRCVEEAKTHEKNCFITLTYNDKNLPENVSLVKRHLQLFIKRLRKKYGQKIRFFACGEYGEENQRPHYHACLFNHDFSDKELWIIRENIPLYRSESLARLWTYGFSTIGDVTFESAAYVARYVMKKVTGDDAKAHYGDKLPEFINMSRRPGVGRTFIDKYYREVYSIDSVIQRNNLRLKPPKYYDKVYDTINPGHLKEVKKARAAKIKPQEQQRYRLRTKEKILSLRLKQLKRGFYEKSL